MKRRHALLGIAALGAGLCAASNSTAQQPKVWRIGFLSGRARPAALERDPYGAYVAGMRELGYVEGKNLRYEWRYADGNYSRLPALAADLVQSKVDLIVAATTPAARAAQKATTSTPIVMVSVADPLGSKLVASMARPGGNITGLTNFVGDTTTKHLELLIAALPKLPSVGVLVNPDNETHPAGLKRISAAAQPGGVSVIPENARNLDDVDRALATMKEKGARAVIVLGDTFYFDRAQPIARSAIKARLPSIYAQRQHVDAGGLMSYGANLDQVFRRAAFYVDRILKGAKPAEMPVEQPTTLELVINLRTAAALGIKLPAQLVARADRVIQ